ncbi:NAD(P)H-dependent oxidoreductase [Streptomyces sp. NPDC002838]|uniref:NAD(P)H-dependent oxidoreductase n=1 Tax=Streptomyces sp. NPDC002838 TaxID=3154436 RepID=UPI0033219140
MPHRRPGEAATDRVQPAATALLLAEGPPRPPRREPCPGGAGPTDTAGTRQNTTDHDAARRDCSHAAVIHALAQGDPHCPAVSSSSSAATAATGTPSCSRRAAAQLPADIEQQWISLAEHPLPDFDDLRHGAGHTTRPEEGNLALLFEATLAATGIVIASPVYRYSLSSHTKRYLDHWTSWMDTPGLGFRAAMAGRTLWGVTTSAGDLPWLAEPLVSTINNWSAFLKMNFGGPPASRAAAHGPSPTRNPPHNRLAAPNATTRMCAVTSSREEP